MSLHLSHVRRLTARTGSVLLAVLTLSAPAALGATTINAGDPTAASPCSEYPQIDTTCLLPLGPPIAASGAVSSLTVGDTQPTVYIVREDPQEPGTFDAIEPSRSPLNWRVRPGTTTIDTAFSVLAGDQLVLEDPRDETTDLCPGAGGSPCQPATLAVAMEGPAYVPSRSPLTWTWTTKNLAASFQPVVVNVYSGEATPVITGPPGSQCEGGPASTATSVFIPVPSRSPLGAATMPELVELGTLFAGTTARRPFGGWSHCRLPALAPGESVAGTVGGSGGIAGEGGLGIQALPAVMSLATNARSTLSASAVVEHHVPGAPVKAWQPTIGAWKPISASGRLLLKVTCAGPTAAPGCGISGDAKASGSSRVLGTITRKASKPGISTNVKLTFSNAGLRWLATHRRGKLELAVTTGWPGEMPVTTTLRRTPKRSAALKRKLAKLATARKK